jgi:CHASE2 domain-containing sensor protein
MPGSFDRGSSKGVKKADADKAVRKMQLIQEIMSGTAKFAPGEKEAVLKAMGISTKKKGGAVKKKKKKSIMLKGRGGKFKGVK